MDGASVARLVAGVVTTVAMVLLIIAVGSNASPASYASPIVPAANGKPTLGGCQVFPSSNAWNRDVSRLKRHPRSSSYISSIGRSDHVHPDFGSNPDYGIPITVVPSSQRNVPIRFTDYGDESDPGPYPVPADAKVEGGGDRHVLVVKQGECKLYELYTAERSGSGWSAGSGAVFDLRSNRMRPAGWTSADAAGLPIAPGLVRYEEVKSGKIQHALRFTVNRSQSGYIAPARHMASSDSSPNLPPMGLRLRLKRSYRISGFHGDSRVVLEALKRYGMIVADNGSDWFISGATDRRWNDDDLNQLKSVPGSAFEAVYTGKIRR